MRYFGIIVMIWVVQMFHLFFTRLYITAPENKNILFFVDFFLQFLI